MPGLMQNENSGRASPTKRKRLSLKFFQKKEAKRALDFNDKQESEQSVSEHRGPDKCDQIVSETLLAPAVGYEKREELLPFVGLNNLGNTCYLNSVLQVLYYCPAFRTGIKYLYNIISRKREMLQNEQEPKKEQEESEDQEELPICLELIWNLHSLIVSMEQVQASFLLNPDKYTEGELAAQPKRLMGTLKELNPMYDGYLQHDAQEVLQCILGYILEACQLLQRSIPAGEEKATSDTEDPGEHQHTATTAEHSEEQGADQMPNLEREQEMPARKRRNVKRKGDAQAGNATKKSKVPKDPKRTEEKRPERGKRKPAEDAIEQVAETEAKHVADSIPARSVTQKKTRLGLRWLKPTVNQPSILSKFCSLGKLTASLGAKGHRREEVNGSQVGSRKEEALIEGLAAPDCSPCCMSQNLGEKSGHLCTGEDKSTSETVPTGFDLIEGMFQGQLVLRTRCLECECYSERREDFQDISVPVQENHPNKEEPGSEISPEPKLEVKTLKWAISQFASVERIVGEDKYFCENCHHYTEAERSLLFDKMPEVVTIHLKCFAACSSELEPYGNLSKVNTPLLTPLKLSLAEWSTRESNDCYELFAVVMHNGVSISNGHYTAYVRVSQLGQWEQPTVCNTSKQEPLNQGETKSPLGLPEYDDGEVSFKLKGNVPPTAAAGKTTKKLAESVGLLGGQKCVSSSEPEKPGIGVKDNVRPECVASGDKLAASVKDQACSVNGGKAPESVGSLRGYEGKWMLFDDSEVRLTDEQHFLGSLSPSSSSTSTPYLLFYKRIAAP
uniref:Ubiquitin carboxyl-terminal hydrolase n=1 Tax=Callorhinchus milii TaxID=7868 RepID=V9KCB9_CALMI